MTKYYCNPEYKGNCNYRKEDGCCAMEENCNQKMVKGGKYLWRINDGKKFS